MKTHIGKWMTAIAVTATFLSAQAGVTELTQLVAYAESTDINCTVATAEDFQLTLWYMDDNLDENQFYEIAAYTGTDSVVVIPDEIDGIPVKRIGTGAFSGTDVTEVVIPEGVQAIDYAAFRNAHKLKSVNIPDGIETIEAETFVNCTSLESITLPDSVTSIGMQAFCDCNALKSIVIPEKVETIDHYAFYASSIKSATLFNDDIDMPFDIFGDHANINAELVICANRGSVGEKLAERMGLEFTTLDNSTTINYQNDTPSCYEINCEIYDAVVEYLDEYYIEKYPEMALEPFFCNESDHELFTAVAKTIVEEAPDVSAPIALYNWMNENIDTNGTEYGYPKDVYNYKSGDCFGNAMLLCEFLRCVDIPAVTANGIVGDMKNIITEKIISDGKIDGEDLVGHEWVFYYYDGKWQTLDSAMNYVFSTKEDICSWYYIGTVDEVAVYSDYYNSGFYASSHARVYKDGKYESVVYADGADIGGHISMIYPEEVIICNWQNIGEFLNSEDSWGDTNYPGQSGWFYNRYNTIGLLKKNGNLAVHQITEYNGKKCWLGQNGFAFELSALDPSNTYYGVPVLEVGTEFTAQPIVVSDEQPEITWDIAYGTVDTTDNGSFVVGNEGSVNINYYIDGQSFGSHLAFVGADSSKYQLSKLTATSVDNGIKISWDGIDNAYRYIIKQHVDGQWIDRAVVDSETTSTVLTGLGNGEYTFAVDVQGKTDKGYAWLRFDNELTATVKHIAKPATPVLTAQSGDGNVALKWNTVNDATSYRIFRANSLTGAKTLLKAVTTTSYTDTTAETGKTYYYFVRAYNADTALLGDYSEPVSIIVTFDAPEITKISAFGNEATICWNKLKNATSYRVFRSDSMTGEKTFIKAVTTTSYTDTALESGKVYFYFIKAYNSSKNVLSDYSAAKSVAMPALTAPVVTVVSGGGNATISWDAVADATSYRVFRSTGLTGTRELVKVRTSTYYIDTAVDTGKTYYYWVIAYNANTGAKSAYSATKTAKIVDGFNYTPVISKANVTSKTVTLTWDIVPGATSYRIYRRKDNGDRQLIATQSMTEYKDTGLTKGKAYKYEIRAYSATTKALSNYSSIKSVRPIASPTITSGNVRGKITWDKNLYATSYRVYRATSPTGAKTLLKATQDLTYTDTAAVNGKQYYYFVAAYDNSTGTLSAYSAPKVIKIAK